MISEVWGREFANTPPQGNRFGSILHATRGFPTYVLSEWKTHTWLGIFSLWSFGKPGRRRLAVHIFCVLFLTYFWYNSCKGLPCKGLPGSYSCLSLFVPFRAHPARVMVRSCAFWFPGWERWASIPKKRMWHRTRSTALDFFFKLHQFIIVS